jgi:hypothetical protein
LAGYPAPDRGSVLLFGGLFAFQNNQAFSDIADLGVALLARVGPLDLSAQAEDRYLLRPDTPRHSGKAGEIVRHETRQGTQIASLVAHLRRQDLNL